MSPNERSTFSLMTEEKTNKSESKTIRYYNVAIVGPSSLRVSGSRCPPKPSSIIFHSQLLKYSCERSSAECASFHKTKIKALNMAFSSVDALDVPPYQLQQLIPLVFDNEVPDSGFGRRTRKLPLLLVC